MKDEILNKGFEIVENRQIRSEAIYMGLLGLFVISTIVLVGLNFHHLNKEKAYEYQIFQRDSLNMELKLQNDYLNNKLK